MGTWWRLEMLCPPELEESLLWKLPDLGIARVALLHRPGAPKEQELVAWLPQADWGSPRREALELDLASLAEPFGLQLPPLRWHVQQEEDWSQSWKQHWGPDPIGRRLLVLPAWLKAPPELLDRLAIRLDPGSAFGTGSHPTTRLCLEALEHLAAFSGHGLADLRVADLGCGSGILGIAALKLGAASVAAVDLDSLAVRATAENGRLNATGTALRVAEGSVEALEGLLGLPADLLCCNILAPVIEALCPSFERLLDRNGVGLLSGLLVEQAPPLAQALAASGWRAELVAQQGGWGLLQIRSRSDVA